MRKILLGIGLILIVAAPIWKFGLSSRYTDRFYDGWTWEVESLGTNLWADEASGQFPDDVQYLIDDDISITERVIVANSENAPSGQVTMSDSFTARDPQTNEVTWEFITEVNVDQKTGQHVGEFAGDYFLFPRNTEKTTYAIRNASYLGVPLAFEEEEDINGINTYRFGFHGTLDNTAAYVDWPLEDGQAIKCENFDYEFWIEPLTGDVVKYLESCPGDLVYDTATDEGAYYISRWSGKINGDDLFKHVALVKAERSRLLWLSSYLPLLLLVGGIVIAGASFAVGSGDSRKKETVS
jgi:hypothetical protein